MLVTGSQLHDTPVMSLQTGAQLGTTSEAIIDPGNLTVVAYEVDGPNLDVYPSFLLVRDVRELSTMGMIIDSSDELVGIDDIIKLKPLYDAKFTVVNKHVIDEHHKKIGKVTDYTLDAESFVIQQLSVKRPLFRSLQEAEALVHRSQIVEINDDEIIVKSTSNKAPAQAKKNSSLAYTNPFRQKTPQPEAADAEPER